MLEEGSSRLPGGSGSVRREADEVSIGRGEPDHASRIRSGSATPSGNRTNVSQIASRQNSRASYGADGSSYANLQSLGPSAIRTELEDLLKELLPETLAGPVLLIGLPKKIGEGGQFYVYQQEVAFLDRNICNGSIVAVKRPIIRKSDQNPDAPIDLADPKVQESLGHIRHEIKALTHKGLRRHPNIVRLLSWAFGEEWDRPFVLVLELAYEDLANALKKKGNDAPSDLLKMRFCSDIANGLEAIHAENIVHGDLKPANVLIFREEWRCVAKLADFGFSTEEDIQAAGGTTEWQPPEAKSSALGDCFTYGLLVWSVLFLCGEAPPNDPDKTRKELAVSHLETCRHGYTSQVTERIKDALKGLLQEETSQRSRRVDQIFDFATEPVYDGHQKAAEKSDAHVLYNFILNRYKWEIRPRSAALLNSLYRKSMKGPETMESMASEDALVIALQYTLQASAKDTDDQHITRKFLESSARKYRRVTDQQIDQSAIAQEQVYHSVVACALASRLYKLLDESLNHEEGLQWLETAVDTGSVCARADLREMSPMRLDKMLDSFRSRGGYNMLYWDMAYHPDAPVPLDTDEVPEQSRLHELAAFGSCTDLGKYIDERRGLLVNILSSRGETALFVACARGSWQHIELLLDRGADPSMKCTASEITCLHWIFALDDERCGIAVRRMLRAGADINALIPPNIETPFPHYPFVLPAGSPLHWAVAISSHDAIRALIEAGADPLVRNGSDPYMYDDRIRHLYAVGGPDAEGCTLAESGCLGMSPVDLAAVHRNPFLLELMAEREDRVDINSADEEGFSVLHRLATSQVFRTSRRVKFDARTFREMDEVTPLRALIEAVKRLGGDIERSTSSAESAFQKEQRSTDLDKSSYTPLMLAVLEADHSLVQALLECGASVHTRNASQTTALFHLSHRANAEQPQLLQCLRTLFAYGADVHHCSLTGNTPLLAAAQGMGPEIFDYFLSQGAHIDERDRTPRTVSPGKSVFAFFASFRDDSDTIMLDLLRRYVFDSSEPEKKRRVIQDGSDSGSTLLHECAKFAMSGCVKALLHYGARVNALERKIRYGLRNAKKIEKEIWYETPLDQLEDARAFKLKLVAQRNALSTKQSVALQARCEEVEEHLRTKGGKSCTPDLIREQWP